MHVLFEFIKYCKIVMLFSIKDPNHYKITYTNSFFHICAIVIVLGLSIHNSAAENWNVLWQEDFGVVEDSVVRDFADPNMKVPDHKCNPAADISDGYYGIANSTAWSFIKKRSVNPRENYHFVPGRDHTGNPNGAMLIVNVGYKGEGKPIYENTLDLELCGNHTYRFSMYVANISAATINPYLTLQAVNIKDPENPILLESYDIPEEDVVKWPSREKNSLGLYTHKEREWTLASINFEAKENDKIKIVIINNHSGGGGNDFALDDIKLERLDDEEIIQPEIVAEMSTNNTSCIPSYSVDNEEMLVAWKKLYDKIYFLWQFSTDNGYTWTNIPEASGIEKTSLEREKKEEKPEVYRLIITGGNTEADAKENAEYLAANGTPLNACDYFSISNIVSQIEEKKTPAAYVGIDNNKNKTNQVAYNCETTNHTINLLSEDWDTRFSAQYAYLWQYSSDDGLTWNNFIGDKSFVFSDAYEGVTLFRAVLATNTTIAQQVAENGTPNDKCVKDYFITNSVSIECLNACKKPEFTAVKDKLTICEDQEIKVTWSVTQTNTAKVKDIEWYSKSEGETEWTLIEGENKESISLENPKISTEYLFLAINGTCISDSVKFQLKVNAAISLKPIADIDLCEGEDATLSATVLTGEPTKFIWNGEESESGDITIENVMADKHVTLSATNGVCVSPEIATDINVEKKVTASVKELPAVICEGESVDLNATANLTAANTFTWKKGSVIITASDLQTTDTPTSDATYTLTINGTHCPSVDIIKTVSVEKKSELELSISKTDVCENDEVTLTLTAKNAPSFVWKKKFKDDFDFFELDNTGESITFNAVSSAEYFVVSKNESACESVESNKVSLNVEPIAEVSVKPLPEMVCEGDAVILAANLQLSEANTFKWQRDGEDIPSIGVFTTDTPSEDANYTLTIFGKKCPEIIKELNTKVEKQADLELLISNEVVCENDLVALNVIATNAPGLVWERKLEGENNFTLLNETGESISVTAEKSASFIVSSKGAKVCGSTASNIVSYTVEDSIRFTIDPLPDTLCVDQTAILNATLTTGVAKNYEWTRNGEFYDNKLKTSDEGPQDSLNVYTLKIEGNVCPAVSKSGSLFKTIRPSLYLEAVDDLICEGNNAELVFSISENHQPVWEKSLDNSNFTEFDIFNESQTQQQVGTYYRIKTRSTGRCPYAYSNVVFVDVEHKANVDVAPLPAIVCEGESVDLKATATLSSSNKISWKKGSGVLSETLNATDAPTEDITYTFTVTGEKCPVIEMSVSTKVEKRAELLLTASETDVCENADVTLNADIKNATIIGWKAKLEGDNEFKPINHTSNSYTLPATKTAEYAVYTIGLEVCPNVESNIVKINVEDSVRFSINLLPDTLCVGESVELNANLTSGQPTSITWERNGEGIASSLAFSDENPADGINRYALTVNGHKCPAVTSKSSVFKATQPEIQLTAEDGVVCEGGNAVISLQIDNAFTPIWEKSVNNQSFNTFDNSIQDATKQSAGTYYRVKSRSTTHCPYAYSNVVFVDVEKMPNVGVTPLPERICEGEAVKLTAKGSIPHSSTFSWKKGDEVLSTTDLNITDTPTEDATYTFTVTGNKCPIYEETNNVQVEHLIEVGVLSTADTICKGDEVTLSTDFNFESGILWEVKGENDTKFKKIDSGKSEIVVSPSKNTIYRLSATSELGCKEKGSEKTIMVDVPVGLKVLGKSICEGDAAQLVAITENPYQKIEWRVEGADEIISEEPLVSLTPDATTTYTINAYNGVCQEETTATITVGAIPHIVSHEDLGNRTYQMILEETTENVYFDYNNSKGKTTSDILSNAVYGMTYTINVSSEQGCSSTYTLKVPFFDLQFHKYFYQGEENWKVENLDRYDNTTMSIFDREGKLLFVEKGTTDGWNGEYNGNPMPTTDYWYVVDIPELDKQFTGHFTLLRK